MLPGLAAKARHPKNAITFGSFSSFLISHDVLFWHSCNVLGFFALQDFWSRKLSLKTKKAEEAGQVGFAVSTVTYKWPTWLNLDMNSNPKFHPNSGWTQRQQIELKPVQWAMRDLQQLNLLYIHSHNFSSMIIYMFCILYIEKYGKSHQQWQQWDSPEEGGNIMFKKPRREQVQKQRVIWAYKHLSFVLCLGQVVHASEIRISRAKRTLSIKKLTVLAKWHISSSVVRTKMRPLQHSWTALVSDQDSLLGCLLPRRSKANLGPKL